MKHAALLLAAALLAAPAFAGDKPSGLKPADTRPAGTKPAGLKPADTRPIDTAGSPAIEVMFVLDTTGSMGGLLEGAKRKVWAIINEMSRGKPAPKILMGLVAYRDRGDEYVTRITPLSAELDPVYEKLLALQADGGGDGPEDVLKALQHAVAEAGWSEGGHVLRVIYLVGDAPPHLDYKDVPAYRETVKKAVGLGIHVNTIRCGADAETGTVWKDIAARGEGKFFTIDQSGGVQVVETPYDAEIAKLQGKLEGTTLAYGAKAEEARAEVAGASRMAMAAAPSAMADRAAYKSKKAFSGDRDLLAAVDEGGVKLESVKEDALPASLKGKSPAAKRAELDRIRTERAGMRKRMAELARQREDFLKKNSARSGKKDGFDAKVVESLREQAVKAGIKY